MPAVLTTKAVDKSTYKVTATYLDATGAAVTPNAMVWKLTNLKGVTVNSRSGTTVTPGTTNTVLLTGDDIDASDGQGRIMTWVGDYDGDGDTGLPLKSAVQFEIEDLTDV